MFMDYFPEVGVFFMAMTAYFFAYKATDFYYRNNDNYQFLEPDRKNYFQKNLVKSYALAGISVYGTYIILNGYLHKNYDNKLIYQVGYWYSALDAMGLLMGENLPTNSKIHHSSTILFSYLNTFVDYNKDSFWHGLPVYCILSCYACGVNYYLAKRLITPKNETVSLIKFNIISYCALLVVNWIYQVYNIYTRVNSIWDVTWDLFLFIGLVGFVVNDDIKLVSFLKHQLSKCKNQTARI